jgi:adhesin/invasin
VRVLDGSGKPQQGTSVTFSLGEAAAAGSGGGSTPQATFVGGSTQATELTDATGRATSPALLANDVAGRLTATATTSGTTQAATFSLRNLAGKATTVTAGVAASARATTGAALPVRLAVTVKDDDDNPVWGVTVTFAAPVRGPSGRFGAHKSRTVQVKTNTDGIAVAPVFKANAKVGGYVVRASVRGVSRPAAFALVNQRPQ